ncbi:MAG: type II secretion system protein [Planctomycetes bacterium]|nr:type II secretion system protein [Planctomycetota bacterium]
MRRYGKKSGFTLSELLVVMAVMMILAAATIPAARQLMKSFETSTGVRRVISAALCNARAIAAKEQHYAGVRFQQDLKGNQYMIFIIHDPALRPLGFRAIEGKKPIKLPANIGVMDLYVRDKPIEAFDVTGNVDTAASNANINDNHEVMDTTTFSIVFSPTGKLVVHEVRVRNRTGNTRADDVFDIDLNVDAGDAMFYQDDYANMGLGQERSRKWFVIYDKKAFGAVRASQRWTEYLEYLKNNETVYVNPRTGEVINY